MEHRILYRFANGCHVDKYASDDWAPLWPFEPSNASLNVTGIRSNYEEIAKHTRLVPSAVMGLRA